MIAERDIVNEACTIIVTPATERESVPLTSLHDLPHAALVSLCQHRKRECDEAMAHVRFLFPATILGWVAALVFFLLAVFQ